MAVLIVIDAPSSTTPPPSFLSKRMNDDYRKITMLEIREACRISKKHAFSVNGKNPLDSKDLTLGQYIDLTPENGKAIAEAGEDKTATVVIKAISLSEKREQKPLDQSKLQKDLQTLLDRAGNGVDGGELPDVSQLMGDLTSLKQDYAAKASKEKYVEPADLTESEWENILFNNRMLHGYFYNIDKKVLVRAPKRAFAIRRPSTYTGPSDEELARSLLSMTNVTPKKEEKPDTPTVPSTTPGKKEYLNTLPGIPSFYIDDDSKVSVVELQTSFQKKMAEQGFSYNAIEANAAGKKFGADASFSASWAEEESSDSKSSTESGESTLQVTYQFPRVVVDLSPEYLQLSDECYADIQNLTEETRPHFDRKYGNAFPTRVVLGGSLHSTREVNISKSSSVEAHKEQMKEAAGLSFAAPQFSFGVTQAHIHSNTTTTGTAASNKTAQLTWEARGGDTVFCSNPPEWATTVKNHRYWRIIDQSHSVNMNAIIKAVDPAAFQQLQYPGVEFENKFLHDLTAIINDKNEESARAKYLVNAFNRLKSLDDFNRWLEAENDRKHLVVANGKKWSDLEKDNKNIGRDQKIMFGMWLLEVKGFDVTKDPV